MFRCSTKMTKRSVSRTTEVGFEGQSPSSFMFTYAKLLKFCFKCCFNGEGVGFFISLFNTCKALFSSTNKPIE